MMSGNVADALDILLISGPSQQRNSGPVETAGDLVQSVSIKKNETGDSPIGKISGMPCRRC